MYIHFRLVYGVFHFSNVQMRVSCRHCPMLVARFGSEAPGPRAFYCRDAPRGIVARPRPLSQRRGVARGRRGLASAGGVVLSDSLMSDGVPTALVGIAMPGASVVVPAPVTSVAGAAVTAAADEETAGPWAHYHSSAYVTSCVRYMGRTNP